MFYVYIEGNKHQENEWEKLCEGRAELIKGVFMLQISALILGQPYHIVSK